MRIFERSPMATTAVKIKQEIVDESFENHDTLVNSVNTETTTSDASTTECLDEDVHHPVTKRRRLDKQNSPVLNGHAKHDSDGPGLGLGPAYQHSDQGHCMGLLEQLNQRRLDEQFIDVVLVVDGKELPCHKVVLCSVSKYFSELLVPNSATRYQQRLYINETSGEILSQLIEYAYTSKITISENNIEHLLSASKVLKFQSVHKACCNVLKYRLSVENCVLMWKFVEKQSSSDLQDWVLSFIHHHFQSVAVTKEFLTLEADKFLLLVSSKNLNVKQEETVYESVMSWVHHDVASRKEHLPLILEHVRLPLVKPQFLLDVVEQEVLIKNNKDCEKFLDEAKRYQLLPEQRPIMQSCRTRPRLAYSLKKTEILVTVGGLNKEKVPLQECSCIDFPDPTSKLMAPLEVNLSGYSVAVVNNNIFVTGGILKKVGSDVWMYIPSLNKWKQVAPMKQARYLHASVGLDGFLYVIGGFNGEKRLRSVEKYDPDTNTWHDSTPIMKALSSPTVAACDGSLFVIGGATGPSPNEAVTDVQWFNVDAGAWQLVAPLPKRERGAVAATLDGIIYVMGKGRSVMSFNRKTNKWSKLNETNGGHLYGAATVHRGQLYIAGGLHGNAYLNGTVEMYDADTDSWQVTATLHAPVYAQGFVSIFKDSSALPSV